MTWLRIRQILNDYFSFKKILNYLSIALLLLLAVPTFLILISWNSLPGTNLYPVKRGLESVALAFAGADFETKSNLRSKLVARRFDEADILLDQSSTLGLKEFNQEIKTTKNDFEKETR